MSNREKRQKYRYYHERVGEAMQAANSGQLQSAISIYTELLADREVSELYNQRGLAFVSLGNSSKAIEDLTRAIELSPEDSDYYVNRGNIYLRLKEYSLSIDDYDMAIRLTPNNPKAFNGRGYALAKLGRITDGIDSLWKSFGLDNSYISPLYNLGLICEESGLLDEAMTYLRRAASTSPNDKSIRELLRRVSESISRKHA